MSIFFWVLVDQHKHHQRYTAKHHETQKPLSLKNVRHLLRQLEYPYHMQFLVKKALFFAQEQVIRPPLDVAVIQCKNDLEKSLKA